ncbi:hydrophobic surface binding protein A-domain-containing protein [Nemania abortiva]|nr:hydrophobic surface binding protein A-domain-containing protein [Nemania abortiva]
MKATTFLPVALAVTASAEMQLYGLPRPAAKRDTDAVSSVASQISDALAKLDSSVKAFTSDTTDITADGEALVSAIKDGASTIAASTATESTADLQKAAAVVVSAGSTLYTDLQAKISAIEAASICDGIHSTFLDVADGTQSLLAAVVKQLPTDQQDAVSKMATSLTDTLKSDAAAFASPQCNNKNVAKSADDEEDDEVEDEEAETSCSTTSEAGYPTSSYVPPMSIVSTSTVAAQSGVVTVTVTAPCACESTTSALSTSTSTSSSPVTIITATTSIPYPTGSNSTTVVPTGSMTTTSASSVPTAGAAAHGVGAVGLMAGLAAALFV